MIRTLFAASLICAAPQAYAQTIGANAPAESGAAAADEQHADGEVVVTGYRGSPVSSTVMPNRPVLDTPFSVNSLGSELLRDQQAISFADVARNDPSIVLAFPQYDDTINLRGFYQNVMYREGLPTSAQVRVPFQNKERVDVFKGLSGFRFGFNSPGGVVNFVVKRPTETFGGFALVGGDEHGSVYGQIDAGGRFGANGQFGARVNLFAHEFESFRNNVDGPQRLYSGIVDWRAAPDLTLEAEYERFESNYDSPAIAFGNTFGGDVARARALLPLIRPEYTSAQPWISEDRSQELVRLGAKYDFATDWTLNLSGHKVWAAIPYNSTLVNDLQPDGRYTLGINTSPGTSARYTGASATLDGRADVFGVRVDLALGYFYYKTSFRYAGYDFPDVSTYLGGTIRPNLFTGEVVPGFTPPSSIPLQFAGAFGSERDATYANATVYLSDSLQLLGGLTYAKLEAKDLQTGDRTYEDDAFSPLIGLLWKPDGRTSAYVSYATGLEEGGSPPTTASNFSPNPFPPIKSEQIEFGVKRELGRGALLTVAAFRIDKGLSYVNDANIYVQDGTERHQGVEATVVGQITSALRLAGGITYLDATVVEASENVGKTIPGIGAWRYSLFADWRTPVSDDLFVTAGIQGDSRKFVTFANDFALPGYALFDLGARYRFDLGSNRLTARLGVQNLFNKRHFESVDVYGSLNFGQVRTVRGSLELAF